MRGESALPVCPPVWRAGPRFAPSRDADLHAKCNRAFAPFVLPAGRIARPRRGTPAPRISRRFVRPEKSQSANEGMHSCIIFARVFPFFGTYTFLLAGVSENLLVGNAALLPTLPGSAPSTDWTGAPLFQRGTRFKSPDAFQSSRMDTIYSSRH